MVAAIPNINQVALSGRIVGDPDFRFDEDGESRLTATLAVCRSYRENVSSEWQEETCQFNLILWKRAAAVLSGKLKDGTPVFATGRLVEDSGVVAVHVRNLQILDKEELEEKEE